MTFDLDKAVDWEIVQTGERLEHVARELADAKVFGWDTETSGLSIWKGARIIGHSFAWRPPQGKMRACYIPIRHVKTSALDLFDTGQQLPVEAVNAALRPALEGGATKIGHHIRYDMHMAFADGLEATAPAVDTVIACKLINENHPDYRLRACVSRARISHDPEWKNALKGEIAEKARAMGDAPKAWLNKYGYQYLSIPSCGRYAAQDAIYTLKLGEWALPQQQRWAAIWEMEMRLLFVILRMERVGVPVDADRLLAIGQAERANMVDYAARIFGMIGKEIDLGNDRQVRKLLFDELGYQPVAFTDHGAPQIDDDSLYHLERAGCEVATWIRKWNRSEKIVTTYTEGIVGLCDQHGLLHGELDQGGARTGRTSMKKPNLQNIPVRTELGRKIREAFLARRGKIRVCIDYSQVEFRVLGHLTQDPLILKIYREGLDAHRMTAIEAFGTADKVGGIDMRRVGKIVNFGVSFGMTEFGLMAFANKDLPEGIPAIGEDQAKDFLRKFYTRYASIDTFRKALFRHIETAPGHEFRNLFGRPRRMGAGFDRKAPNAVRRAEERAAMSTIVSGTAADMVKHAMVAVDEYLRAQTDCAEADMVLMVHDDLQFDLSIDGSAKTIRELKRLMEQTCQAKFTVPILTDVEWFSTNWAEKNKMKGL